jgi:hypothetical protein
MTKLYRSNDIINILVQKQNNHYRLQYESQQMLHKHSSFFLSHLYNVNINFFQLK